MAESHPKFDVALVTPDGAAFDGEAEMVVVPGAAGEIGVLGKALDWLVIDNDHGELLVVNGG